MRVLKKCVVLSALLFLPVCVLANLEVTITSTKTGKSMGVIHFRDTASGLLISPDLHGLTPGPHGFHLHTNPSCAAGGKAAGGHWDPKKTNQHLGPYSNAGHWGDLPVLTVGAEGKAIIPVLDPHLRVLQLYGHSLIVHGGGDNYSDHPAALGGGGARVACGVVQQ